MTKAHYERKRAHTSVTTTPTKKPHTTILIKYLHRSVIKNLVDSMQQQQSTVLHCLRKCIKLNGGKLLAAASSAKQHIGYSQNGIQWCL